MGAFNTTICCSKKELVALENNIDSTQDSSRNIGRPKKKENINKENFQVLKLIG